MAMAFIFYTYLLWPLIALAVVGGILFFVVYRHYKNSRKRGFVLKFVLMSCLLLYFSLYFMPVEFEYKIAELTLYPALQSGTPLEDVRKILEQKDMKYGTSGWCRQDVKPCKPDKQQLNIYGVNCRYCVLSGRLSITLYFDEKNELIAHAIGGPFLM
jgi:hypothetical protein